jgi:adenylate cyclase class IV
MELEVVMQEGQSDAEGQSIAESLMTSLGVERTGLLEGAYMDLLESSQEPMPPSGSAKMDG